MKSSFNFGILAGLSGIPGIAATSRPKAGIRRSNALHSLLSRDISVNGVGSIRKPATPLMLVSVSGVQSLRGSHRRPLLTTPLDVASTRKAALNSVRLSIQCGDGTRTQASVSCIYTTCRSGTPMSRNWNKATGSPEAGRCKSCLRRRE